MEHKITEKLLKLVKARPAIYDLDARDHYHKDTIRKLWAEIAEEMGLEDNFQDGKIKEVTEKDLQKRREQKKLSMRHAREKLKANTEKYEEVRKKDAERKRATRKKIGDLNDREKINIRKGWRERAKKHRANKKNTENAGTSPDSPLLDDHQVLQGQPIASTSGAESVEECRMKYRSLRVSYTRYIKGVRKKPEPGARKPRFHYAEAMNFLEKHTLKKSISSINQSETAGTGTFIKEEPESPPDFNIQENCTSNYVEDGNNDSEVIENERSSEAVADSTLLYDQRNMSQDVADSMVPCVENAFKAEEDPIELFFKSIKADVDTLDSRRKLKFKSGVLQLINELIEEQEPECILPA